MMKKSIRKAFLLFFLVLTAVCGVLFIQSLKETDDSAMRERMVDLNEIVQLARQEGAQGRSDTGEELSACIKRMQNKLQSDTQDGREKQRSRTILLIYGTCAVFIVAVFLYIDKKIVRPFKRLEKYAADIAGGNLEVSLPYERANYFGAFTWAFDHMRREIIKAKACEREAIENNKTVIATLSHDIKTPIASIRAYAEALEANLDTNQEKRRRYSDIITKKCDEVAGLTNDLFLHSLADLNKLKIQPSVCSFTKLIETVMDEMPENAGEKQQGIRLCGELPNVYVRIDSQRFIQVVENLRNNCIKYAEGVLELRALREENKLKLLFCDHGPGINEQDIPFIFEKFYRGQNAAEKPGAGLGLFIVRYIMEQMGGTASLRNTGTGLEVTLELEIAQQK